MHSAESGIHEEPGRHQETREGSFRFPKGFTDAGNLGYSPATTQESKAMGLIAGKPGMWCQENGVIAIINSEGRIGLWIPKEDPTKPRTVSYDQAIASLDEAGYTEGDFAVPSER
jgi:hypothetical protein